MCSETQEGLSGVLTEHYKDETLRFLTFLAFLEFLRLVLRFLSFLTFERQLNGEARALAWSALN